MWGFLFTCTIYLGQQSLAYVPFIRPHPIPQPIPNSICAAAWLGLPISRVVFHHDLHQKSGILFWGNKKWQDAIVGNGAGCST
jgi:hypothetical protein